MDNKTGSDIRIIQIVYAALMAGIAFFAGMSLLLNLLQGPSIDDATMNSALMVISVVFLGNIPIGIVLFKKRLETTESQNLDEKLATYRGAMIVRAALMEGSGFFGIVCFLLTGNNGFILLAAIILAIIAYFFPTRERMATELGISSSELE